MALRLGLIALLYSAGTRRWSGRRPSAASPSCLVQDILRHLDLKGQGRAACVSKLCAAAVAPLAPALAHYVTAGDAPAVRRLLQKPDGRLGLDNPSCEYGRTPLLEAVSPDSPDIFEALLEAGAATEARDSYGRTALILAAAWGRASMVQALVAAGAALEAEGTYDGRRPLHIAAKYGRTSNVEALVAAGAAVEAEDWGGRRPLHFAAMRGHASIVEALLAAGASLDAHDKEGWRPLHEFRRFMHAGSPSTSPHWAAPIS